MTYKITGSFTWKMAFKSRQRGSTLSSLVLKELLSNRSNGKVKTETGVPVQSDLASPSLSEEIRNRPNGSCLCSKSSC